MFQKSPEEVFSDYLIKNPSEEVRLTTAIWNVFYLVVNKFLCIHYRVKQKFLNSSMKYSSGSDTDQPSQEADVFLYLRL